ncbi:MAG: hypothetical protein ABII93_05750 [Chrysiogenia bacterium]
MFEIIINFINNNAGLLVAVLALFVSVYESIRGRRHDRLSMKPYLHFLKKRKSSKAGGLYLVNNGIGPAILTKFEIYLDNQLIKKVADRNPWSIICDKSNFDFEKVNFCHLETPYWMPAKEEYALFALKFPVKIENDESDFLLILERVQVKIKYQSCYAGRILKTMKYEVSFPLPV